MEIKDSFWGGIKGKIVASCLVLVFVLGTITLCFVHEKNADVLLDVDEVDITDYEFDAEEQTLTLHIKTSKSGYYLSNVDTYEKTVGTGKSATKKMMVRFYGSLSVGDYVPDNEDSYTVTIEVNEDITNIVQEGKDYNNGTIANLHSN